MPRRRKGFIMRLIIGNVLFGAIISAWYAAFGGEREVMLAGTVIVLVTFVLGTCMGCALSSTRGMTPSRASRRPSAVLDTSVFDQIH